MNVVLMSVLGYVALQLVFGVVISRRIRTEADYLLAGRSLGFGLGLFTVFATWFGAETCVGAAGRAYSSGLSANAADPFGYGMCLLLMGAVFAVPLWRRKLTTLADLFRERFGPSTERVAVLLMVPTSLMWAGAQIRAFGQVLGATSELELTTTITIAAAVVTVYTMLGGLLADAISDLVQGSVLIVGLVVLFAAMLLAGDGAQLTQLESSRVALLHPEMGLLDTLEEWAIPLFGSVVAQELVARVIAARSPEVARRAALSAGVLYLLVGLIPVGLGLVASLTLPDLAEPEQVLIVSASHYLPLWLYVVFAGALVSAILSTVDSALLVAGSLCAHNLVLPLWPHATERQKLLANRLAVLCFGVLAYGLALSAEGVYALVEEASALGSAGVFACVVLGLFTRVGGNLAALWSLVVGFVVYAGGAHVLELPQPYLCSLLAAFLAYAAGVVVEQRALRRSSPSISS